MMSFVTVAPGKGPNKMALPRANFNLGLQVQMEFKSKVTRLGKERV
jgi:hypothetical protein